MSYYKVQVNNFQKNEELNIELIQLFIKEGFLAINEWGSSSKNFKRSGQCEIFSKIQSDATILVHYGKKLVGVAKVVTNKKDLKEFITDSQLLKRIRNEEVPDRDYSEEEHGALRNVIKVDWNIGIKTDIHSKEDLEDLDEKIKINIRNTCCEIHNEETQDWLNGKVF